MTGVKREYANGFQRSFSEPKADNTRLNLKEIPKSCGFIWFKATSAMEESS